MLLVSYSGDNANDPPKRAVNQTASLESIDALVDQIPYAMTETLAAYFELGQGAKRRARHIRRGLGCCRVGVTRCRCHYLHHPFGIGLPVCGHVQRSSWLEPCADQLDKCRLDNAALVVLLLGPGIGEE